VRTREAFLGRRMTAAEEILAAADERDAAGDARDTAADNRENDSDRAKLVAPPETYGYGDDWPERRNAGLDRVHSKDDRAASHDDRIHLTQDYDEDDPGQT
jgi:hypothetical protein